MQKSKAVRALILAVEPELKEGVKWNSPSYAWNGEDRITFNLATADRVRLVFHAGATRKEDKKGAPLFVDDTGLLQWQSDIRAIASFHDVEHVQTHAVEIQKLVRKWLDTLA